MVVVVVVVCESDDDISLSLSLSLLEIDMNLWCFSIAPSWQNFLKTASRGNITR